MYNTLTLARTLLGLVNGLDDTDSDSLPHVTDGETTKRRVLVVSLNAHRLRGDELDNAGIARLDELRRRFQRFTCPAINLLDELRELAGNVGGVAIEDGGVTCTNLTGVVENDDLSVEGRSLLSGVVLRVRADIATTNFLDGDVPERHVISQFFSKKITEKRT